MVSVPLAADVRTLLVVLVERVRIWVSTITLVLAQRRVSIDAVAVQGLQ